MQALSEKQLYEFDVTGCLTIKNFLTQEYVAEINEIIDKAHASLSIYPHKFQVMYLHEKFFELLTRPLVMQICKLMLGDWFRLDHVYGLQYKNGLSEPMGEDLHGGPRANQGSFRYSWANGKPQCGLLVFSYILNDVKPNDGGLVIVPGSHKQNMGVEGRHVYVDYLRWTHDAWWVQQPTFNAGDLFIFTEALVHGTKSWKPTNRGRRNLYYKYTPGHLCWRRHDEIKKYLMKSSSDLIDDLLRAPFVASYDDSEHAMGDNQWRGPTRI